MMYKFIHGYVGLKPEEMRLQVSSSRTRASHSWKLFQHRTRTEELRHSFTTRTIPEWNSLPATLAEADSLDIFKSQLAGRMSD